MIDSLSILTAAEYVDASDSGLFTERYGYDLNGNMTSRTKAVQLTDSSGNTTLANLVARNSYTGNRMRPMPMETVTYDACGRLTGESSGKVRSIRYNEIGLPQEMTLSDGSTVNVVYAADGRKLREKVTSGSTSVIRNYSGNCIFEGSVLKKVLFEGGYIQMSGNTPTYLFFLTDHLGSVRVVADENGTVRQVNQYYPYGDLIEDANMIEWMSDNRYRFTGKELATETGLYDFCARYLETSMGRFTTIDPLAEKYPSVSPYVYCAGDPVNYVDLFGLTSYNVNGETRDIQDGRDEIVEVSKLQYARLNRMWNNDKSKQYNRLNKKIRDTTGYINADGDFVLAASFCINLPSYTEYMSRSPESTLLSVDTTVASTFFDNASKQMYNEKRGTWTDRKGTIRKMSFNGNGYTGGRVKFAKAASKTLKTYSRVINGTDYLNSAMTAYENRDNLAAVVTCAVGSAVSAASAFIPYIGPYLPIIWSAYGEYLFYTHVASGLYQDDETD